MSKEAYVYILASKKNGTLYTGVTNNLEKRILVNCNTFFPRIVKLFPHPKMRNFRLRQPLLFRSTVAENEARWPCALLMVSI